MVEVRQLGLPDGDEASSFIQGFHIARPLADAEWRDAEIAPVADLGRGDLVDDFRGKLRQQFGAGDQDFVEPLVGGLGAFVAGSNTVSNMMFALFQFGVGQRIGADPDWIVALQAVGGAAGNTICVHNVVAAAATVGLLGREGLVIRRTLVVFVYYAALAGLLGYAIVWLF